MYELEFYVKEIKCCLVGRSKVSSKSMVNTKSISFQVFLKKNNKKGFILIKQRDNFGK